VTVHVADTDPYPWPYDGRIDPGSLALIVAGWDVEWAGRTVEPATAVEHVAALAVAVESLGGLVIVVAHGGRLPLSLEGARPTPVTAHGLDALYGGPLDALLRAEGRTHLLVAGHGLEGPVHSTLRSLNDRGYECLLVADACSALTPDLAPASAKTVTMSGGIFGAVGTTGAVLDALAAIPRPSSGRSTTPAHQET
jgi:hypothetical protein